MNETIETKASEQAQIEPSTATPVPVLPALQTAGNTSGQKETTIKMGRAHAAQLN